MNVPLLQDWALAIRERRKSRQLSQGELGRLVRMPQSQIARIESGVSDVRLSTLIELARALDLEPVLVPKQLAPAVRHMITPKKQAAPLKLVGNDPEDASDER